jgi:hypothetical protein
MTSRVHRPTSASERSPRPDAASLAWLLCSDRVGRQAIDLTAAASSAQIWWRRRLETVGR